VATRSVMLDGESVAYRVVLHDESDIVVTRRHVRELGQTQQLSRVAIEALATAATEVARNALIHAKGGEILLGISGCAGRRGVVVIARDEGPGIADVEAAMRDGYSTGGGLGMGLPGARRLVDAFELMSVVGEGTTVTLRKWQVLLSHP
jgi:serine/threonine-protein kinase RsbT